MTAPRLRRARARRGAWAESAAAGSIAMPLLLLALLALLLLQALPGIHSQVVWNASGSRPVVVAVGDGKELAQFPASLSRFGSSDALLLIVAGNPDGFMPKGGWGREFASYDDGASWAEIGPPHPVDGDPKKGVACIPGGEGAEDELTCIPFRLRVDKAVPGNRSGVEIAHVWRAGTVAGPPTRMVGVVNVSVVLPQSGGTDGPQFPQRWGTVPDMVTPLAVKDNWLLTMYSDPSPDLANGGASPDYNLLALTSQRSDGGKRWTQLSLIKNNTGTDGTQSGPCSGPSENDVVELPSGELAVFYRNQDGAATSYSTNIPLCVQLSTTGGESWSSPCQLNGPPGVRVPQGVEPKVVLVGEWLVVISGRNGLFAYYTNASTAAHSLATCGPLSWERFNIAAHHNEYLLRATHFI